MGITTPARRSQARGGQDQARLRHASAKPTLDMYGHIWPDRDESTRAAVDAVITARTEQRRNNDEEASH